MIRNKYQKGFVPIGLGMAAAALLGLAASITLLALNSARMKARDTKRASDVTQLAVALRQYHDNFGHYPPKILDLEPKYIGKVPSAPTPPDGSCNTQNNEYIYTLQNNDDFTLTYCFGQTGPYMMTKNGSKKQ